MQARLLFYPKTYQKIAFLDLTLKIRYYRCVLLNKERLMSDNVPNKIALHIAKRMTAIRLHRAWTRDELAKRADVNVHTLKRFERTGQISLPRLIALCEILDMLDDLIRAFKPRQRVSINDWQIQESKMRQRGRRKKEAADN